MKEALHHIRLLAIFEIQPGSSGSRFLTRADCERLAAALAADLARAEPEALEAMLIVGGSLLEPSGLLRPGFQAWAALGDLAQPAIREHGTKGQVLAIGAHHGRLPDARLRAEDKPPDGRFLAVPLLLVGPEGPSKRLRARLEETLFEAGGVSPPAQAVLAETTRFDTVHGQLLTLGDLMALQHVQMDTAGMGPFWPVVEHVLVSDEERLQFSLPARLEAAWHPDQAVVIRFVSFDQYPGEPDEYPLWVRAFRSLCALLDNHGIPWQIDTDLDHDPERECVIENAGPIDRPDSLTEQVYAECGLFAWTRIEAGDQVNFYPLTPQALERLAVELAVGLPTRTRNCGSIRYDSANPKLRPPDDQAQI
ncbi:MAG: hypothetical protein ACNA7J_02240 [Wenzhouxiangella sp.]